MITSIKSNKIILSLLFIIVCSCTKVIDIEENLPMIDSIVMDSHIEISEIINDTTWYEINLYISDDDGLEDIDEVVFHLRRDSLYLGETNSEDLCEYTLIQEDEFITYIDLNHDGQNDFSLLHTYCIGDIDSNSYICEELISEDCQVSDECIFNISESEFLYYTLIPFRPLFEDENEDGIIDGCGGFGKVSYQFLVRDLSGNEYLSDIIELEIICAGECP